MPDAPAPAAPAARASAGAIMRHSLTVAGTALVARSYVDQWTADNAIGPVGDYVLGAVIALRASGYGVFRARFGLAPGAGMDRSGQAATPA